MVVYKPQRIRDPLHDLIDFDAIQLENTLWDVVQTRPYQRLRRVKQLAFSELTFPGATHTRFAHSLGVFHIAKRLLAIIHSKVGADGYNSHRARVALTAALVHDIGHGPFSHSFETAGKELSIPFAKHEEISAELISNGEISNVLNNALGNGFATDVAKLIAVDGPTDIYSAVVSSQFDADRLDYIQRDPLMSGTQHSRIDFTWLMANLEIAEVPYGVDDQQTGVKETFVLNSKAFFAAESYVLGLFHLYPTVYFHKATRSAEKLFTHLLLRLHYLVSDNNIASTNLSENHPLINFLKSACIDNFLPLDDMLIWGAIHQTVDASDKCLADISLRLRDRKLLKCIDIRKGVQQRVAQDAEETDIDRYCLLVEEKIVDWLSGKDTAVPRIILDVGKRSTYNKISESKGPLNRIHIKENDTLLDISDLSKAVKASGTFKFIRGYTDDDDNEAIELINATIDEATKGEQA